MQLLNKFWRRDSEDNACIRQITALEECEAVLKLDSAIIFKHSPACDLSRLAYSRVVDFCAAHENSHVYLISVLDHPQISQFVTAQTGIQHESPQIIALRRGEVIGNASHRRITESLLKTLTQPGE